MQPLIPGNKQQQKLFCAFLLDQPPDNSDRVVGTDEKMIYLKGKNLTIKIMVFGATKIHKQLKKTMIGIA